MKRKRERERERKRKHSRSKQSSIPNEHTHNRSNLLSHTPFNKRIKPSSLAEAWVKESERKREKVRKKRRRTIISIHNTYFTIAQCYFVFLACFLRMKDSRRERERERISEKSEQLQDQITLLAFTLVSFTND